ncbi:MAG: radical SAM protein, partial [Deltaproteobacteria bacterium]
MTMPRLDDRRLTRLAAERRLFAPGPSGPLSVCLVYPNTYPVAMANLGFQAVLRLLSEDARVACDRAFLPDGDRAAWPRTLRSFEQDRPVGDFDVVAFSVSFESDYLNVLHCLRLAGIPLRSRERGPHTPLVVAGGPATFLNPEPLADFVDLFLIGEAEEMLGEFLDRALGGPLAREAILERTEEVVGVYRPGRYTPVYDERGDLVAVSYHGAGNGRVRRRFVADLDRVATNSEVLAPEAVFGDMYLVETSRGCEWGCRLCAAGFMYRPVRYRSLGTLRASVARGPQERRTIGLVGAEMASLPGVAALCQQVAEAGGRASPSSLKADMITPALAAALGRNGNRSVTVAPEAGSERMRRVVNKNLTESEILRTETAADVAGIVDLTAKVRARLAAGGRPRVGRILVSINPFVPKPWTPFQWEPMEAIPSLRAKLAALGRALAAMPGVQVEVESPREAYLQTLLSRGDRRTAAILERLAAEPDAWWPTLRRLRGGGSETVDPDRFVHRSYPLDAVLPWDFIDHSVDKRYLAAERRKAL